MAGMPAQCANCEHAEHEHEPGDACIAVGCGCGFFVYAPRVGDRVVVDPALRAIGGAHGVVTEVDDDPDDAFTVRVALGNGQIWLCPDNVVPGSTPLRS